MITSCDEMITSCDEIDYLSGIVLAKLFQKRPRACRTPQCYRAAAVARKWAVAVETTEDGLVNQRRKGVSR
jgi:hypothetical protein